MQHVESKDMELEEINRDLEQKLEEEVSQLEEKKAQYRLEKASHSTTKGKLTKMMKQNEGLFGSTRSDSASPMEGVSLFSEEGTFNEDGEEFSKQQKSHAMKAIYHVINHHCTSKAKLRAVLTELYVMKPIETVYEMVGRSVMEFLIILKQFIAYDKFRLLFHVLLSIVLFFFDRSDKKLKQDSYDALDYSRKNTQLAAVWSKLKDIPLVFKLGSKICLGRLVHLVMAKALGMDWEVYSKVQHVMK